MAMLAQQKIMQSREENARQRAEAQEAARAERDRKEAEKARKRAEAERQKEARARQGEADRARQGEADRGKQKQRRQAAASPSMAMLQQDSNGRNIGNGTKSDPQATPSQVPTSDMYRGADITTNAQILLGLFNLSTNLKELTNRQLAYVLMQYFGAPIEKRNARIEYAQTAKQSVKGDSLLPIVSYPEPDKSGEPSKVIGFVPHHKPKIMDHFFWWLSINDIKVHAAVMETWHSYNNVLYSAAVEGGGEEEDSPRDSYPIISLYPDDDATDDTTGDDIKEAFTKAAEANMNALCAYVKGLYNWLMTHNTPRLFEYVEEKTRAPNSDFPSESDAHKHWVRQMTFVFFVTTQLDDDEKDAIRTSYYEEWYVQSNAWDKTEANHSIARLRGVLFFHELLRKNPLKEDLNAEIDINKNDKRILVRMLGANDESESDDDSESEPDDDEPGVKFHKEWQSELSAVWEALGEDGGTYTFFENNTDSWMMFLEHFEMKGFEHVVEYSMRGKSNIQAEMLKHTDAAIEARIQSGHPLCWAFHKGYVYVVSAPLDGRLGEVQQSAAYHDEEGLSKQYRPWERTFNNIGAATVERVYGELNLISNKQTGEGFPVYKDKEAARGNFADDSLQVVESKQEGKKVVGVDLLRAHDDPFIVDVSTLRPYVKQLRGVWDEQRFRELASVYAGTAKKKANAPFYSIDPGWDFLNSRLRSLGDCVSRMEGAINRLSVYTKVYVVFEEREAGVSECDGHHVAYHLSMVDVEANRLSLRLYYLFTRSGSTGNNEFFAFSTDKRNGRIVEVAEGTNINIKEWAERGQCSWRTEWAKASLQYGQRVFNYEMFYPWIRPQDINAMFVKVEEDKMNQWRSLSPEQKNQQLPEKKTHPGMTMMIAAIRDALRELIKDHPGDDDSNGTSLRYSLGGKELFIDATNQSKFDKSSKEFADEYCIHLYELCDNLSTTGEVLRNEKNLDCRHFKEENDPGYRKSGDDQGQVKKVVETYTVKEGTNVTPVTIAEYLYPQQHGWPPKRNKHISTTSDKTGHNIREALTKYLDAATRFRDFIANDHIIQKLDRLQQEHVSKTEWVPSFDVRHLMPTPDPLPPIKSLNPKFEFSYIRPFFLEDTNAAVESDDIQNRINYIQGKLEPLFNQIIQVDLGLIDGVVKEDLDGKTVFHTWAGYKARKRQGGTTPGMIYANKANQDQGKLFDNKSPIQRLEEIKELYGLLALIETEIAINENEHHGNMVSSPRNGSFEVDFTLLSKAHKLLPRGQLNPKLIDVFNKADWITDYTSADDANMMGPGPSNSQDAVRGRKSARFEPPVLTHVNSKIKQVRNNIYHYSRQDKAHGDDKTRAGKVDMLKKEKERLIAMRDELRKGDEVPVKSALMTKAVEFTVNELSNLVEAAGASNTTTSNKRSRQESHESHSDMPRSSGPMTAEDAVQTLQSFTQWLKLLHPQVENHIQRILQWLKYERHIALTQHAYDHDYSLIFGPLRINSARMGKATAKHNVVRKRNGRANVTSPSLSSSEKDGEEDYMEEYMEEEGEEESEEEGEEVQHALDGPTDTDIDHDIVEKLAKSIFFKDNDFSPGTVLQILDVELIQLGITRGELFAPQRRLVAAVGNVKEYIAEQREKGTPLLRFVDAGTRSRSRLSKAAYPITDAGDTRCKRAIDDLLMVCRLYAMDQVPNLSERLAKPKVIIEYFVMAVQKEMDRLVTKVKDELHDEIVRRTDEFIHIIKTDCTYHVHAKQKKATEHLISVIFDNHTHKNITVDHDTDWQWQWHRYNVICALHGPPHTDGSLTIKDFWSQTNYHVFYADTTAAYKASFMTKIGDLMERVAGISGSRGQWKESLKRRAAHCTEFIFGNTAKMRDDFVSQSGTAQLYAGYSQRCTESIIGRCKDIARKMADDTTIGEGIITWTDSYEREIDDMIEDYAKELSQKRRKDAAFFKKTRLSEDRKVRNTQRLLITSTASMLSTLLGGGNTWELMMYDKRYGASSALTNPQYQSKLDEYAKATNISMPKYYAQQEALVRVCKHLEDNGLLHEMKVDYRTDTMTPAEVEVLHGRGIARLVDEGPAWRQTRGSGEQGNDENTPAVTLTFQLDVLKIFTSNSSPSKSGPEIVWGLYQICSRLYKRLWNDWLQSFPPLESSSELTPTSSDLGPSNVKSEIKRIMLHFEQRLVTRKERLRGFFAHIILLFNSDRLNNQLVVTLINKVEDDLLRRGCEIGYRMRIVFKHLQSDVNAYTVHMDELSLKVREAVDWFTSNPRMLQYKEEWSQTTGRFLCTGRANGNTVLNIDFVNFAEQALLNAKQRADAAAPAQAGEYAEDIKKHLQALQQHKKACFGIVSWPGIRAIHRERYPFYMRYIDAAIDLDTVIGHDEIKMGGTNIPQKHTIPNSVLNETDLLVNTLKRLLDTNLTTQAVDIFGELDLFAVKDLGSVVKYIEQQLLKSPEDGLLKSLKTIIYRAMTYKDALEKTTPQSYMSMQSSIEGSYSDNVMPMRVAVYLAGNATESITTHPFSLSMLFAPGDEQVTENELIEFGLLVNDIDLLKRKLSYVCAQPDDYTVFRIDYMEIAINTSKTTRDVIRERLPLIISKYAEYEAKSLDERRAWVATNGAARRAGHEITLRAIIHKVELEKSKLRTRILENHFNSAQAEALYIEKKGQEVEPFPPEWVYRHDAPNDEGDMNAATLIREYIQNSLKVHRDGPSHPDTTVSTIKLRLAEIKLCGFLANWSGVINARSNVAREMKKIGSDGKIPVAWGRLRPLDEKVQKNAPRQLTTFERTLIPEELGYMGEIDEEPPLSSPQEDRLHKGMYMLYTYDTPWSESWANAPGPPFMRENRTVMTRLKDMKMIYFTAQFNHSRNKRKHAPYYWKVTNPSDPKWDKIGIDPNTLCNVLVPIVKPTNDDDLKRVGRHMARPFFIDPNMRRKHYWYDYYGVYSYDPNKGEQSKFWSMFATKAVHLINKDMKNEVAFYYPPLVMESAALERLVVVWNCISKLRDNMSPYQRESLLPFYPFKEFLDSNSDSFVNADILLDSMLAWKALKDRSQGRGDANELIGDIAYQLETYGLMYLRLSGNDHELVQSAQIPQIQSTIPIDWFYKLENDRLGGGSFALSVGFDQVMLGLLPGMDMTYHLVARTSMIEHGLIPVSTTTVEIAKNARDAIIQRMGYIPQGLPPLPSEDYDLQSKRIFDLYWYNKFVHASTYADVEDVKTRITGDDKQLQVPISNVSNIYASLNMKTKFPKLVVLPYAEGDDDLSHVSSEKQEQLSEFVDANKSVLDQKRKQLGDAAAGRAQNNKGVVDDIPSLKDMKTKMDELREEENKRWKTEEKKRREKFLDLLDKNNQAVKEAIDRRKQENDARLNVLKGKSWRGGWEMTCAPFVHSNPKLEMYSDVDSLGGDNYAIGTSEATGNCFFHSVLIALKTMNVDEKDFGYPYLMLGRNGGQMLRRHVVELLLSDPEFMLKNVGVAPDDRRPAKTPDELKHMRPDEAFDHTLQTLQCDHILGRHEEDGLVNGFRESMHLKEAFLAYDMMTRRDYNNYVGRLLPYHPDYYEDERKRTIAALNAYAIFAIQNGSYVDELIIAFTAQLLRRPICVHRALRPERPTNRAQVAQFNERTDPRAWMKNTGLIYGPQFMHPPFSDAETPITPIYVFYGPVYTFSEGAVQKEGAHDHYRPILPTFTGAEPQSLHPLDPTFIYKSTEPWIATQVYGILEVPSNLVE